MNEVLARRRLPTIRLHGLRGLKLELLAVLIPLTKGNGGQAVPMLRLRPLAVLPFDACSKSGQ